VLVLLGGTTWASDGFWAPDGAYARISQIVLFAWIAVLSGFLAMRPSTARARAGGCSHGVVRNGARRPGVPLLLFIPADRVRDYRVVFIPDCLSLATVRSCSRSIISPQTGRDRVLRRAPAR
jgi:hypothetical protein